MQKSNNEFLLSFCRRVIMWCPENGMSHRKREIKERSIKVEVIFSGNESIIRWKELQMRKNNYKQSTKSYPR